MTIEERVARLEKSAKCWRMACGLFAGTLLLLMCSGAEDQKQTDPLNPEFNLVHCRGIVLMDENGKVAGSFGTDNRPNDEHTVFDVGGGLERVRITAGKSDCMVLLGIGDAPHQAAIYADKNEARVRLQTLDRTTAALMTRSTGGIMGVYNMDGKGALIVDGKLTENFHQTEK